MPVENPAHFFKSTSETFLHEEYDIVVIGGGLAGLTSAALLAKKGKRVLLLERNYIPGGCASSYFRNRAVFDSGATTLLGLSEGMPLKRVLDELELKVHAKQLEIPMQVHLTSSLKLTRYQEREAWVAEAERVFGKSGQRKFWERCFALSDFVWSSATRYRYFPPVSLRDFVHLAQNLQLGDLPNLRFVYKSVANWMKQCGLGGNDLFGRFIDQQLMITAQNSASEVNLLFGAAALCYTNYPNYTLPGGMVRLVRALTDSIAKSGGHLLYRTEVIRVKPSSNKSWIIETASSAYRCNNLIVAIPLQNLNAIAGVEALKVNIAGNQGLNSAFQFNAVLKHWGGGDVLHHQVHNPIGNQSVFFSVSAANDGLRASSGLRVLSATTHAGIIGSTQIDKNVWAQEVIELASQHGLFTEHDIVEYHVSDAAIWQQWTGRFKGFVGGNPQFMSIKPWMMNKQQKGKNLFFCGDSVYPGQGIPGVVLSGWQVAGRVLRK